MTGPISSSEKRVPWASPAGPSASSPVSLRESSSEPRFDTHYILLLDEHQRTEESSQPLSSLEQEAQTIHSTSGPSPIARAASARGQVDHPHRTLTQNTLDPGLSLNVSHTARGSIELDSMAPKRALRESPKGERAARDEERLQIPVGDQPWRRESSEPPQTTLLHSVADETKQDVAQPSSSEQDLWGQPFPVSWIRTERLPFFRTRHFRNPWNNGREVKVSRDGTELEPSVGQLLLEEWDHRPPSPLPTPAALVNLHPSQRQGRIFQNLF